MCSVAQPLLMGLWKEMERCWMQVTAPLHRPASSFPSALFSLQQAGTVSKESDPARSWAPGGQEFSEKAAVPAPIVFQVLVALSVKPTPACVCKDCCELHRLWLLLGPRCLPRASQEAYKQAGVRKFMCASNKNQLSLLLNMQAVVNK